MLKVAYPLAALAIALPAPATAQASGDLMAIYRDFHANPELSMQEVRSAAIMAREARKAGFTVTEKIGKTGLVAVMKNGPGPTLMIRADMDALRSRSKPASRSHRRSRRPPARASRATSCTPAATTPT